MCAIPATRTDRPTVYVLADAFYDQECVSMARQRIELLEIYLHHYRDSAQEISQCDCDPFSKWFMMQCLQADMERDPEFIQYQDLKKYLEIVSSRFRGGVVPGLEDLDDDDLPQSREKLDIERARQAPIIDLYPFERVRRMHDRTIALCPFHHEKTPSFVIYHQSNSYYCFSCQVSGDSIKFIMEIESLHFINAVKRLGG